MRMRIVIVVVALPMLVGSACVMQQGEPLSTTPATLLSQAHNMRVRGDVVACDHLLERAQHTHPGSVSAVMATVERVATPPGLMQAVVLGALGATRIPSASVDGCPVEDEPELDL